MGNSVPAASNDTMEARGSLELNDRPAAWDEVTLGDLFTFKNGLNKAKKYFGSGVPIVNYMDVFQRPGIRLEDVTGRVELTPEEIESFEVRRGDVFFTRTSETVDEIGIASVMLDDPFETVFSGFVLRARPLNELLDNYYKQYCFASRKVRSQIVSRATYTTRALTNGKVLSNVRISVPPTTEQQAIAEVLSDVDSLIGSLSSLIAKKRVIKQAVAYQLLSGENRLPGFSGKWKAKRLGEIAFVRNDKALPSSLSSGTLSIELDDMEQGTGRLLNTSPLGSSASPRYRFFSGDVLFGRLRPYLRKFWHADRDGVCTTEIWPLRVECAQAATGFLYETVQTHQFISVAGISYGTHMPAQTGALYRTLNSTFRHWKNSSQYPQFSPIWTLRSSS